MADLPAPGTTRQTERVVHVAAEIGQDVAEPAKAAEPARPDLRATPPAVPRPYDPPDAR
jgi:hypothetical protein